MTLPDALARAVTGASRVGGGSINEAWSVELEDGRRAFVKTRAGADPGEFQTEAAGLRWLAEPGAVPLPEVIAVGEDFLALEWIEEGRLGRGGAAELGRGLAALHAAGADGFGAPWPLHIGEIVLSNAPLGTWPAFYAERRLRPTLRMAVDRGTISERGARAVERVCERIDDLAGPDEPPARLHGDLWGGNVLAAADGCAWLVDPVAYGGHREIDLAMLRLFGSPGARVFDAYEEAHPLAEGHEERVPLWQLFPLLVHAVLFGGGYGASVESAASRFQ